MAAEYWLSDQAWAAIAPRLPTNQPGARRVDDRRVISGILHVLRSGCRWQDCPAVYGPSTTIYNRWNRWSRRGVWTALFEALASTAPTEVAMIDSTAVKAQRASAGGKGGIRRRPSAARAAVAQQRSMPSATD
jgi:transposase